ncbi:MAG: peptidyl-prolyl cis-trans isomerase [Lachnospiraceae bacterium]|nr:peptidyl-prolyl cis-trans isomerase [Lachnospiraceae bacterium]
MNFILKIFSLSLSIFLLTVFLAGCSEIRIDTSSRDMLIEVDKEELSTGEGIYRLLEQKVAYEGEGGSDIWSRKIGSETLNDYVKEAVLEELTLYTASVVMAGELGVYMTDEDKTSASKAAEEAFSKVSGRSSGGKYVISLEGAKEFYIKKATYEKVYEAVTKDVSESITENSTKVICVDYVVIPSRDAKEAREVYEAILAGTSFEEACTQAGYHPQMNQVLYPKTMSSVFESVAFALTDGELSEVVESKSEYYIIRCIDDKMLEESAANYTSTLAEAKNTAFNEYYINFAKKHKLSVNRKFWKNVDLSAL